MKLLFSCRSWLWFAVLGGVGLTGGGACAHAADQHPPLADFFGFDGLEVIKIGRGAGPLAAGDMNGDGLTDLIVVNNRKSRIELHLQKRGASRDDPVVVPDRVNEFPEHWRLRRENVAVTKRVAALIPYDFNRDGLMDLIYAGAPGEVVFLGQTTPGVYKVTRKHRVKNLGATRNGFAIADVVGDEKPELVMLVNGEIHLRELQGREGNHLGPALKLAAGSNLIAFILEDFNGDGGLDVMGAIPDDPAPIRLWLSERDGKQKTLGPQVRFEMPALHDFAAVRLPGAGEGGSEVRLAVLERAAKRLIISRVATETIESYGDREAALRVRSFTDAGNRKRHHAVVDVDGDGLLDLLATDTRANALVIYRQRKGRGLLAGEPYPSLTDLVSIAAANVDDDPEAEIFVLSEKEGVVGRCDTDGIGIPFPKPIPIREGNTPVAMNLVVLNDEHHLAVISKSGRKHLLEIIDLDQGGGDSEDAGDAGESGGGGREQVDLGALSRSPETIIALDADQDGHTDLLLFTRDKPMMMIQAGGTGDDEETGGGSEDKHFVLRESKDMGQYGLVKAATADNTAIFDIDGDGKDELLIADKNFVRALRYDPAPAAGVSPGWQVVAQINAADPTAKLVAVVSMGKDSIVAADTENDRLVMMRQESMDPDEKFEGNKAGGWVEAESIVIQGFDFKTIHAGAFTGSGEKGIHTLLAVGDDGFAVVRLAGVRVALREEGVWRTDYDRRRHHELAVGDLNADGFPDLIALDAGEQMCEIFTFTETGNLLHATSFKVFESRLFSGGNPSQFEPSMALIEDITGDKANDLILLAHDRVLIYPQMTSSP